MKRVISKQYVYNTDSLIVKEGLVIRVKLETGEFKWTSLTGTPIKDEISNMLEERFLGL